MKKWMKKMGVMTVATVLLFSGASAAYAADEVNYGMTGAMAVAAVHMQAAYDTTTPTVKTMEVQAPAENMSASTIAGKEFTKQLDIVASAYSPNNAASEYNGLTYMGTKVRPGVIAVDPNVIPLGSKVFITGYNNPLLPAGGFVATAEDTGGAIKGNRIDIFLNGTEEQVLNFGMQNVKVYVLK